MQFPNFQPWFDKLDSLLSAVPIEIALVAFFIPIVLALFSKRIVVFFSCVLIAAIALSTFLHPSSITSIVVLGAYFSSILLAIFGINASRQASAVSTELINLRSELDEMKSIDEKRYLVELKRERRKQKTKSKDKDSESLP